MIPVGSVDDGVIIVGICVDGFVGDGGRCVWD